MHAYSIFTLCLIFKSFASDNHNNNEEISKVCEGYSVGHSSALQPQSLILRKMPINSLASKLDHSRNLIIHRGMQNFNQRLSTIMAQFLPSFISIFPSFSFLSLSASYLFFLPPQCFILFPFIYLFLTPVLHWFVSDCFWFSP